MEQKIQCPNCGATSDFFEKKPGFFNCKYCGSSFEYVSIVPNLTMDKHLFIQIEKLYHELKDLLPDRPKYHNRIFSGIVQMSNLINNLSDINAEKDAFRLLKELLNREINMYSESGFSLEKGLNFELLNKDIDLVKAIFFKQMNAIWAQHLLRLAKDEATLIRVLKLVETAENVPLPAQIPMVVDLRRIRFGLLRRLNRDQEAFAYLDVELKNSSDQEQFKYDFEDIFNSDVYNNYKLRL